MFNKIFAFIYRNLDKIILITAILLSIGSFIYYYNQGLITAYGDSRGHLNIARRVVDSLNPGVAQLGGYWLPLLHILMLPTIWIDFMWQSGISGSVPNMIAFVLSVIFIYKLAYLLTENKFSSFIAALILLFNMNLLYMQATPMTESLFISTLIMSVYFFCKWIKQRKIPHLIFAALFFAASSLNRYEGWAGVLAASTLLIYEWIRNKFSKKIEGAFFLFTTIAWLGISLWMLWGLVIFRDPFEFLHNPLSAGTQTKVLEQQYAWTGFHNIFDATLTNILAISHVSGFLLMLLFFFGFLIYLINLVRSRLYPNYLPLLLLITPFIFEIITVYFGKVPVEVPEISKVPPPMNYFNIRYALYTLPAIAIFVTLISKKKIYQLLILALVILNYVLILPIFNNTQIVVLKDGGALEDSQSVQNTISWFKVNYQGGLILASTGGNDKRMFDTRIDQKNFITEGTGYFWNESLQDPTKYAEWIILSKNNPRDLLDRNINKEKLFEEFSVVNENNDLMILKINK